MSCMVKPAALLFRNLSKKCQSGPKKFSLFVMTLSLLKVCMLERLLERKKTYTLVISSMQGFPFCCVKLIVRYAYLPQTTKTPARYCDNFLYFCTFYMLVNSYFIVFLVFLRQTYIVFFLIVAHFQIRHATCF